MNEKPGLEPGFFCSTSFWRLDGPRVSQRSRANYAQMQANYDLRQTRMNDVFVGQRDREHIVVQSFFCQLQSRT